MSLERWQVLASSSSLLSSLQRPLSILNTANIDTLLGAVDSGDSFPEPSEALQDRIHFIFNNLSANNLEEKVSPTHQPVGGARLLLCSYWRLCLFPGPPPPPPHPAGGRVQGPGAGGALWLGSAVPGHQACLQRAELPLALHEFPGHPGHATPRGGHPA